MNSFEAEVFDVLESKGIPLVPQVGASSYRIDLDGRYVLAIECDGASYHSSPTARDRDRLRQQQLENLGWKFHRIWSTDWFMRKDEEVARAVSAYENAVASISSSKSGAGGPSYETPSTNLHPSPIESQARGVRPYLGQRDTIADYSDWELMSIFDWIESDGRLRTDEEMIDEILPELGFHRRGSRIEGVLKSTLAKRRNRTKPTV